MGIGEQIAHGGNIKVDAGRNFAPCRVVKSGPHMGNERNQICQKACGGMRNSRGVSSVVGIFLVIP